MFIRQVKRKCSVRGCKNTECFAISRTREVGNTVIICKSCLDKALRAIDEIDPKTKSNIPTVDNTPIPSLFFNAKALGTATKAMSDNVPPATSKNGQENTALHANDGNKEPDNGSAVPPADDITDAGGTTPPEYATEFECPICGKEFDSEKGLKTHIRYCKLKTADQ